MIKTEINDNGSRVEISGGFGQVVAEIHSALNTIYSNLDEEHQEIFDRLLKNGYYKVEDKDIPEFLDKLSNKEKIEMDMNNISKIDYVIETVEVIVPRLKVKSEPSYKVETIEILNKGEQLDILEQINNWGKIRLDNGKYGWIRLECTKDIEEEEEDDYEYEEVEVSKEELQDFLAEIIKKRMKGDNE